MKKYLSKCCLGEVRKVDSSIGLYEGKHLISYGCMTCFKITKPVVSEKHRNCEHKKFQISKSFTEGTRSICNNCGINRVALYADFDGLIITDSKEEIKYTNYASIEIPDSTIKKDKIFIKNLLHHLFHLASKNPDVKVERSLDKIIYNDCLDEVRELYPEFIIHEEWKNN